eukprot:gene9621-11314_t
MAQFATFVLLTAALYLLVDMYRTVHEEYAPIPKITQTWETQPIVSVYVLDAEKAGFCKSGYERFSFSNEFAITSVTEGPCGCALNSLSYHSTNEMCPTNVEKSDYCMSLRALPEVPSVTYRTSGICIKRGGNPAATYHKSKYHSRPYPDYFGACPAGHKACGAICFPVSEQCPITDMIILPATEAVPVGQEWEAAGVFPTGNVLYVRREQIDALPIVNIVARLTEMSALNTNMRGECYKGPHQTLHEPIVSNSNQQWSYTIDMPQRCDVVDLRYHLFDSVDLESHFLDNVQDWKEVSRTSAIRTEQCTDPLTTDMLLFGLEDRFGRCLLLSLVVMTLIAFTRCTIPRHPVGSVPATISVSTTATTTGMAAATTSRAAAVVANPVTVQMVRQDRDGVYESLPQDEQNMV